MVEREREVEDATTGCLCPEAPLLCMQTRSQPFPKKPHKAQERTCGAEVVIPNLRHEDLPQLQALPHIHKPLKSES